MPLVQSDAFEVTANMASVFMWGPSEASLVFEEKDLIIPYLAEPPCSHLKMGLNVSHPKETPILL